VAGKGTELSMVNRRFGKKNSSNRKPEHVGMSLGLLSLAFHVGRGEVSSLGIYVTRMKEEYLYRYLW